MIKTKSIVEAEQILTQDLKVTGSFYRKLGFQSNDFK